MRTVTVTEKYNAVLEGRMAKSQFIFHMRQQYPMYISQFSGFDDTVQILKNRNMLYELKEEAKPKVYDEKPALTYSLDALDRGIRIELGETSLSYASTEEFKKAETTAKANLEKNANHYLDLMSGESNKVDKHDKEVEVKRGAATVDTFNGMKKATLKEEVQVQEEEFEMSEDAKKALLGKVVGALRTNYPDITAGILKDFIKTHYQDLLDGADIEDEFREYISVNYEGPSDMGEKKGTDHDGDGDIDGDDYMAAKDKAIKKAMGNDEVDENADAIKFAQFIHAHGLNDQQVKDSEYLQDLYNNYVEMLGEDTDEGYAMKRMQQAHTQDRLAGKKSTYDQAKEKDDKKEKQLKEAIKSIIKKTLNEDVVNEAATNRLSSINDEYSSYAGAQTVINQLENVVTEIEQFHSKTRDKIQKIYDGMENIENEEGLKIGVFIGPSIEAAFRQDLRPVTKKGYTSDLSIPKAKRLDPNLVAQARAQGDIEEIGDAKHTVFSPNN